MENLFMFLATSLVLRIPSPKFKRFAIGNSGCSSLLFSEAKNVQLKHTEEGDEIYFNDHLINGVTYGLITIKMKELHTLGQAENILVQYINGARKPFNIVYNISMQVEKTAGLVTITDYWQDKTGLDWKIKGYTDGKTVSVLYVKNVTNAPVKEHDAFLNGFRFSYSS